MPYIEVHSPQGHRRLELSDNALTVGRLPDNTLVIADEKASRHHCVIEPVNGGFQLRDLKSSNGTKLNNKPVTIELLDNGDVVRIGATELRFIDPEQQLAHKRRKTPDFKAAQADLNDPFLQQATVDIDLNDEVTDAQTGYEKKLREIINSAHTKPFDENDISLVDSRGTTVHQAESAGLDSGSDDEAGEGIRAFRLMLLAAFRGRATDIHMEPRIDQAAIRLRVDGYMISAVEISMSIFKRILGVVKILCQIDTSQKNAVQDGHFSVSVKGKRVDYRVSLTPSMHGQKLVVRVLDSSNAPSRLHELGLIPWMYEKLRTIANRVLGKQLRVCVKLEAGPVLGSTIRAGETTREMRARFEQDPIVRAMLERFGGRISDVKQRGEA